MARFELGILNSFTVNKRNKYFQGIINLILKWLSKTGEVNGGVKVPREPRVNSSSVDI